MPRDGISLPPVWRLARSILIATWRSLPLTALNSISDLRVLRSSEITGVAEIR